MSINNWDDIYRLKESPELYKIYRGSNYSTYDQKKIAFRILNERKFDFENTENQIKEWNRIKKRKIEEERINKPLKTFIDKNHALLFSIFFGIIFLIFLNEFVRLDKNELEFSIYFMTFGPLILVLWGLLTHFLINKKKKNNNT